MLKRLGLGALIWIIMFAWVSILMFVFGLESGWLLYILTWLMDLLVVWYIAGLADLKDVGDAFVTAVEFVVVGLLLDWLVTTKFNPDIFTMWSLWVGYVIVLFLPVLRSSMKK